MDADRKIIDGDRRHCRSPLPILRIVIDTVGFVRAAITPYGPWGRLFGNCVDQFELVVSEALKDEIIEVLERPAIQRKTRRGSTEAGINLMRSIQTATLVEAPDIPPVCRDPDDDKILAAALAGQVDVIGSEDKDLLDLESYEGIPIVNGWTLLDRFRETDELTEPDR